MYFGFYPHLPWPPDPVLYNCSGRTAEEWLARGTVNTSMGWCLILGGMTVVIVYSLVIYFMILMDFLANPFYRMMCYCSCFDITNMFITSVVPGYMLLEGVTFCSHPFLSFWAGGLAEVFWLGGCIACIGLSMGRAADVTEKFKFLKSEKVVFFWLPVSILVGIYCFFFTHTMMYNSTQKGFFFIPFLGDNVLEEFQKFPNYFHPFINFMTGAITVTCYTIIFVYICVNRKHLKSTFLILQKRILLQSILVSGSMAFTAWLYVIIQFVQVPTYIHTLAVVMVFICESSPMIVYLFVNQSLRQKFFSIFRKKKASVASTVTFSDLVARRETT